jgi:hypothetical protein
MEFWLVLRIQEGVMIELLRGMERRDLKAAD